MADLWVVLTVLAFFAVCVLLIRGCDRIIGSDEHSDLATVADPSSDPVETSR